MQDDGSENSGRLVMPLEAGDAVLSTYETPENWAAVRDTVSRYRIPETVDA